MLLTISKEYHVLKEPFPIKWYIQSQMIVKRGIFMRNEKNCKSLLITIGWINALFAFVFFQLFCGIIAVCMGIVLKSDYHAEKHGFTLIIVGIIGGRAGWILNYLYF